MKKKALVLNLNKYYIGANKFDHFTGSFTDCRDGKTYKTIKIGNQTWMAENLKVTKYQNGDLIGTTDFYKNIETDISPKYQWVNIDGAHTDEAGNLAAFGRLYTWAAVTDERKICPLGWHIPTHDEWIQLSDYVGGNEIAGGELKEIGYTHWNSPNTAATDKYGFSARAGGTRSVIGGSGNLFMYGDWWSATEYELNPERVWSVILTDDFPDISFSIYFKNQGNSVRCLKD